jgi:hypothetical protein
MKRRSVLKSAALLPAAAAIPAAAQNAPTQAAPESFKLELAPADVIGRPVARFFSPDQFAALRKLGELFAPAFEGRPGASETGAAEFLDFYISQSAADVQKLYRDGLDRLNSEARRSQSKPFAELTSAEAAAILKPLSGAWTYAGPSDLFARFLLAAKDDLMRATTNSRPYTTAAAAGSRGGGGLGYYWLPVE